MSPVISMVALLGGASSALAVDPMPDYTRTINGRQYVFKDWTHNNARSNANGNWDMRGRLYVPDNYDPTKSYPLVMFLHGDGEAGSNTTPVNNNTSQVNGNINNLLVNARARGFLVYAPQAPNTYWSDAQLHMAQAMIARAVKEYNVDPTRIYTTGLSKGGAGTLTVIKQYSDLYAAFVPLSVANSIGDQVAAAPAVGKHIWFYHGRQDGLIGPGTSRASITSILRAQGVTPPTYPSLSDPNDWYFSYGNLRYTEYANAGHNNDTWSNGAYNDSAMYDWLLSKQTSLRSITKGESIAVSFGPGTVNTEIADSIGRTWNVLGRYGMERTPDVAIGYANDTTGGDTIVSMFIAQAFGDTGTSVPANITAYGADSASIAGKYWRTYANQSAQLVFENLIPGQQYELELFASTTNANYRGLYEADGVQATLLATNNLDQFVTLTNLTATPDGTLTLTISPTGGATFAVLNSFTLTAVPEPGTLSCIGVMAATALLRRRSRANERS